MPSSIFCPDCGMLKNRCVCGKKDKKPPIKKTTEEVKKPLFIKSLKIGDKVSGLSSEYSYKMDDESQKHVLSETRINELKKQYPDIDEEIIYNFPFPQPRNDQLDIILDIYEAIESGYKYIVLEAGTGTGKSAIATTLARIYENAYIFTMTKQLQNQYSEEFSFPTVKGRANFDCLYNDAETTCELGRCKTVSTKSNFVCPYGVSKNPTLGEIEAFDDSMGNTLFYQSDNHCSYWEQKADAINADITLMNYDYAFLELNFVKHFPKRNLIVFDEAHNIEEKLMRRLEVTIYNERLEKDIKRTISPGTLGSSSHKDWILEIEAIYDAYDEISLEELSRTKVDNVKRQKRNLNYIKKNLQEEPRNWVIDSNDKFVTFKPLRVHQHAEKYLFQYGDVCLFMSATILSERLFCKWLGLNYNEVYFVKQDTPFEPSKRPIELLLAGKMSKNRIKESAPNTLPILNKILKKHKKDKGLIHTNSYQCQKYIMNNLMNSRLISHQSQNRSRVLREFERSLSPLVLVSPSMGEGVDLPYDKCRFQVIYKMPFPYLGDKQINLRRKQDSRWYAYKTVMTLIQAYGRGMRAEDDSCHTYILDESVKMIFKSPMYRSLLPEFFTEAIVNNDITF